MAISLTEIPVRGYFTHRNTSPWLLHGRKCQSITIPLTEMSVNGYITDRPGQGYFTDRNTSPLLFHLQKCKPVIVSPTEMTVQDCVTDRDDSPGLGY